MQEIIKDTIQKSGHHPFLFIGSGMSKRYMNTEKWDELLRYFCVEFSNDEFKYDEYATCVEEKDYYGQQPAIASLLERDYNKAVFSDARFSSFKLENKELIQRKTSPFKIAVSKHLLNAKFDEHDDEIKLLRKLAQRSVSGIITTNYDTMLEQIFRGYRTYVGQEELIFANLSGIGEIYKIHGSVMNPESIVITSKDYKDFEEKSAYLIAKILTIFLEYPIIFLGYSLQDRNIQNILKTISSCLSQEKLDVLKERLIFIDFSNREDISELSFQYENGNVIRMIRVSTEDYISLYNTIYSVKAKYSPKVLRQLRKDIYELASNEQPTGKIVATGFETLDEIDNDTNFILGVGIQKVGHLVKAEQIYEDIVLDNQYFNPVLVVEEYLPELLKNNSGGLPMYKYLKDYEGSLFERVKENSLKYTTIDSFLNRQLRMQKVNYRKSVQTYSVETIIEMEGEETAYRRLIFLEENEIDIEEMGKYLRKIIRNKTPDILKNNSELKRLIRIYDLIRYK